MSARDQSDAARPVSLSAGAALGPYRLLHPIAPRRVDPERSEIWLAEAGQGRELVLKIYAISARTPMTLRRVKRESQLALRCAQLPAVVTTEFAGPVGDWWVIAMERLGPTLLEHHRERKDHQRRWRDSATYARWIEQIAWSLGEMHRAGSVHRDIKYQNIMLDPARSLVKLADFSRARRAGEGDHAPKSDQLELALVAWILLTGRRYPADPRHLLSAPLRQVLLRATAPRPSERFPDMASFARALRAAAAESASTGWTRRCRFPGVHRLRTLLRRS